MSKTFHVRRTSSKRVRRKTSIEDLADEGYTIGRILGEGSYCKVKSAIFQGREIAVKIITRDQLSLDFSKKFLPRELSVLAKIRHPNLVHVHKIFSYPRRIYIFMERIGRGDLLNLIRNCGRLMEWDTQNYFKQMVSGIRYLHSLNIAHRDLKCENIMITETDEVKIIDFGFCRSTVDENGKRELSKTFCGSAAYASPEVLQGIPYNPMMYDVWSLGCVLYIMVTGTMPFDDSNVRKMVTCQLKKKFKYPDTFTIAKPIKTLVGGMLEPDVTKRTTMNQISQNAWLKREVQPFPSKCSIDEDDISDIYKSSTGKKYLCRFKKIHVSGRCSCTSSSDDSD